MNHFLCKLTLDRFDFRRVYTLSLGVGDFVDVR